MKILICAVCNDFVAPRGTAEPRWCACARHAVWWRNPFTGAISVFDAQGARDSAFILGLHNGYISDSLIYRHGPTKARIQEILDETPDSYLFKQHNSVAVRFVPGSTGDSEWASEVPGLAA